MFFFLKTHVVDLTCCVFVNVEIQHCVYTCVVMQILQRCRGSLETREQHLYLYLTLWQQTNKKNHYGACFHISSSLETKNGSTARLFNEQFILSAAQPNTCLLLNHCGNSVKGIH